ncbi:Ig-like domain-containing protein, partial [Roseisolibacter sp. H3M3-2]|uniref:Ig-like domain-containing protein n=1 Tax=Roseisolibacter sp. H3M3-2 TaxID=3031323 RepID=UPI0023DC60EA
PTAAPVAAVELTPAAGTVAVGDTLALAAATRDAAGATLVGRVVTWSSAMPEVARVDSAGRVTGVATGTTTVAALSEGRIGTAVVTVVPAPPPPAPVHAVIVLPSVSTAPVGGDVGFVAVLRDSAGVQLGPRPVRWSSSDAAVAVVDSTTGAARAVGVGTARITAAVEGRSGSAVLAVIGPPARVASVTVAAPPHDTLEVHDRRTYEAVLLDAERRPLSGRAVRWASSDTAVAVVDPATGAITARARGATTVTATSEGVSGSALATVVVRYRAIAAGQDFACDLASAGVAWCWGADGGGTPARVVGDVRFVQLAASAHHACGVTVDGAIHCWGAGESGQLGDGTGAPRGSAFPLRVAGAQRWRQVSVGRAHSCAVTTADEAFCWGDGLFGQLGTGGSNAVDAPAAVAGGLRFASVAAGDRHSCALTPEGRAYCWGDGASGQLGAGAGGAAVARVPRLVGGGETFASLAARTALTCGVTAAVPEARCWGANGGALGLGTTVATPVAAPAAVTGGLAVRQVAAGDGFACAVTLAGEVWCWGANDWGQLGDAAPPGRPSGTPTRVRLPWPARDVAVAGRGDARGAHACAIAADRLAVACWGRNDAGQLGNGTTASTSVPGPVTGQQPPRR